MTRVEAEAVVIKIKVNRLVSSKGKVIITSKRGTIRRLGILTNKPRRRIILLTRPARNTARTILGNADKGLRFAVSVERRGNSLEDALLSLPVIIDKARIKKGSLGLYRL